MFPLSLGFATQGLSTKLQTLIPTRSSLLIHPSLVEIGGTVLRSRMVKLVSSLRPMFRRWSKVRRVAYILNGFLLTLVAQIQSTRQHCTLTRARVRTSLRSTKVTQLSSSTSLKRIGGKPNVTVSYSSCLPRTCRRPRVSGFSLPQKRHSLLSSSYLFSPAGMDID